MSAANKIYFTKEVVDQLIVDTINKVPGIDENKSIRIFFKAKSNEIDVEFSIKNNIDNVFSVIKEVQNYIFFCLCKMFDLTNITVNINIK